jgi:site-specific DNA-cytosine methylase
MKLLDLFCGGGGCSMGYSYAGFEVEGVDINPNHEKYYPMLVHHVKDTLSTSVVQIASIRILEVRMSQDLLNLLEKYL